MDERAVLVSANGVKPGHALSFHDEVSRPLHANGRRRAGSAGVGVLLHAPGAAQFSERRGVRPDRNGGELGGGLVLRRAGLDELGQSVGGLPATPPGVNEAG